MLRCLKVSALAAAAAVVGPFPSPVAAQTYTVGVENIDYFPQYSFRDGEYRGFSRALLDAFAKDKGYTFDYRPLPVARLFATFVAGDLDLKYPDNALWSADLKKAVRVTYSAPVVAYIDGVSVLPARVGQGPGAVAVLGMVRGFTAWDWLDRIASGTVRVQENNSFTALLDQALLARVDGVYANVAVVNHLLETVAKTPGGLVFDPGLPHTRSHYHLSSIRHPALIAEFDAWMAADPSLVARLKEEYRVEKGVN